MTVKECYERIGGDYSQTIARLGSDERVVRFMSMFLQDKSFEGLCLAVEKKQWGEAFRAAHSMKGVCLNLGYTALAQSSAAFTDNLRTGEANEDTAACFAKVKADYEQTVGGIDAYFEEPG